MCYVQCRVCGRNLSCHGELNRHLQLHRRELAFHCRTCDMRFSRRSLLNNHTRSRHTGERPFVCDICGNRFSSRQVMVEHRNRHSGELSFCPFCGKGFSQSANLRVHILHHIRERPYPCNLCSMAFYSTSALRRHCAGVHQEERNDT